MKKYFIAGGLGFIGSSIVKRLLDEKSGKVIVYDNYSSGKEDHLDVYLNSSDLEIIKGDIKDLELLEEKMMGADFVYSVASNPDISKAMVQPDIDFWEGTYLINNVLEAMRKCKINYLIYPSGSGVYGDVGSIITDEDYSPLLPCSTYGASKLACEALICSYCHMFDINAAAFRFANVVGPNQTHGVGYDFIRKLIDNPHELTILGDGKQSKSYIYIDDIVDALRKVEASEMKGYSYFNVATLDYISVTEIADITTRIMGLENVRYNYTGGDRGWKGDVPIVRLDTKKLRGIGWSNRYSSEQAIGMSVRSMYENIKNH